MNAIWESVQTGPPAGVMPWGKHKNRPFNEIPREYLVWAVHHADAMKPELRRELELFLGLLPGSTTPPPDKPSEPPESPSPMMTDDAKAKIVIKVLEDSLETQGKKLRKLESENANLRAELALARKDRPSDMDVFRRIVKQAFAAMSRRWHPDLGGDAKSQTIVNAVFKDLLSRLETTP